MHLGSHCPRFNLLRAPLACVRSRSPMTDSRNPSEQAFAERRVITSDGRLTFELRRVDGGVLVRRHHSERLQQVEHSIVFSQPESFHRYLGMDQLRFTYVLQYVELKRAFDDLLATDI